MSDSPATAKFIFVDRRKTGRGKSLPNREKLLHRIKESIRAAKPQDLDSGKVGSGSAQQVVGSVKVARGALAEPTFRYGSNTGEREVVLPGNDRWLKGDEFPIDSGDGKGGSGGSGPGEDGEDDFIVNISRNEFLNVFFEDCELPDLEQTTEKDLPEAVNKPAGFQKEGTPGQLSIIRSYRNSLGRRRALTFDDREEIVQLEDEYKTLLLRLSTAASALDEHELHVRMAEIEDRLSELRRRIASIPMFEKVDHRYRKSEKVLVKSAEATLLMAMDVSGSMDEDRKRLARRFFSMQYAFIVRKYPSTDLVFVYHTDTADEVTEEEFFTSRRNGGTIISTAIELAHKIIKDRYDPTQTNLYFTYAGDGDNWESDNSAVIDAFETSGFLSKLRHAVYVQVGPEMSSGGWMSSAGQSKFWTVMSSIAKTSKKLHNVKVVIDDDIFTAFKKVYGKKPKKG